MSNIDIVIVHLEDEIYANLPSAVEVQFWLPTLVEKLDAREASRSGRWKLCRLSPDADEEIEYRYSDVDTLGSAETLSGSRLLLEWVDEVAHDSASSPPGWSPIHPEDDHRMRPPIEIRKKESPAAPAFTTSAELTRFGEGSTEGVVDLRVFRETLSSALTHVNQHRDREVGGYFFGYVTEGQADRGAVVHIIGHYPINSTDSSRAHFKFLIPDSVRASKYQELRFPGSEIVGWYHSHPGHGIFLSPTDTDTHQNYFKPYHSIAMVADPLGKKIGFFVKDHGEIIKLGCAWIFNSLEHAKLQSRTGLEEGSDKQEQMTVLTERSPKMESTDYSVSGVEAATPEVASAAVTPDFEGDGSPKAPSAFGEPAVGPDSSVHEGPVVAEEAKSAIEEDVTPEEPAVSGETEGGPESDTLDLSTAVDDSGPIFEPGPSPSGLQDSSSESVTFLSRLSRIPMFRGFLDRHSKSPTYLVGAGNAKTLSEPSCSPTLEISLGWIEAASEIIGDSERLLAEARDSVATDRAELANDLTHVLDEFRELATLLENLKQDIHNVD